MRRFSWFVLVKCVDYPIRMRHFSSRAIALGANFANKEIGRFTKIWFEYGRRKTQEAFAFL